QHGSAHRSSKRPQSRDLSQLRHRDPKLPVRPAYHRECNAQCDDNFPGEVLMRRETTKTLSAFLAWTLLVYAQQPPTQPPPQQGGYQAASEATKFSITSTLVIETVNVKDKSGKAIEGLTAKDFTITEDNVPQTIKFF